MAKENKVNLNKPVVVDSNILRNYKAWEIFPNSTLAKDVMLYISKNYQEDLFGMFHFDLHDFVKTMPYSRARMSARVDKPFQFEFENLTKKQIEELRKDNLTFETVFEDVIYRLHKVPLSMKLRVTNGSGDKALISRSEILIPEFNCVVRNTKTHKKEYMYKISESFVKNLANYYSFLDLPQYYKIPRGLSKLYLFLCDLRQYLYNLQLSNKFYIAFDELSMLCNTKAISVSERKKYINTKFTEISKIDLDLKTSVQWEQKGKFDFQPVIVFENLASNKFKLVDIKSEKINFLIKVFINELILFCRSEWNRDITLDLTMSDMRKSYRDREKFYAWLITDKDLNNKLKCYLKARDHVFPNDKSEFLTYMLLKFIEQQKDEIKRIILPLYE